MATRKKPSPFTGVKWRGYLQGKYEITNQDTRNKMNHDIRKRAVRLMEDLLLICQKMPRKDRIRIFRSPSRWKRLSVPLARELVNNACYLTPDAENFDEIQRLAAGLTVYKMKYDIVQLVEDVAYRDRKNIQLLSRRGAEKTVRIIKRAQNV